MKIRKGEEQIKGTLESSLKSRKRKSIEERGERKKYRIEEKEKVALRGQRKSDDEGVPRRPSGTQRQHRVAGSKFIRETK